ncbi:MAG: DUF4345 domain-containing protein [Legionella sp.]|nr:DUF4345 domain-containing protein [Legionella sp.]
MERILKYLLNSIFVISLLTGMNVLINGTAAIPGLTTPIGPMVDNELRCVAIFWLAFGVFCFWVSRNIIDRYSFIPAIAFVLFLSGIARLLSIVLVGMPGNQLLGAMGVEVIFSVAIYLSYQRWHVVKPKSLNSIH